MVGRFKSERYFVVLAWLAALVPGCGGNSSRNPSDAEDSGGNSVSGGSSSGGNAGSGGAFGAVAFAGRGGTSDASGGYAGATSGGAGANGKAGAGGAGGAVAAGGNGDAAGEDAGGAGSGGVGDAGTGGGTGGSNEGGAAGSSGVTYHGCSYIGGLDRIAVRKHDPERDLCVLLELKSPTPSNETSDLTLPASWGVNRAIAFWPATPECSGYGTAPNRVESTAQGGVVSWSAASFPDSVTVDVVLTFPQTAAPVMVAEILQETLDVRSVCQ